jgi:hypothetical protein
MLYRSTRVRPIIADLGGKMPHLDFRQAFSSPIEPAPPIVVESGAVPSDPEENTLPKQKRTLATRVPRLHRSDRTTLLFAVFVFAGGFFCAFYFFNGGEFLRAAAAWSREFLYPRPSAIMAQNGKIDNFKPKSDSPQAPSADPRRNSTSPFRSDLGSLYPPTFNNSPSAGSAQATLPPGAGSLLDQLNIPPPGGDALLQSFNRAVDNMVRATTLFANSTATVVQTTVKQAPAKNAQLNSATQRAGAAGNISARQNGQQTSRTLNKQTQAATSTVRSLDLRQQGSGIQGILGPGGLGDGVNALGSGAGLGGVGGGGGEGALGGAMGGAGGIAGGLTGGH